MIPDLKFSNMTDGFSNAIAYKCQINSFPLGGVAISHKIAVARPTLRIRNAGETNSRRKWVGWIGGLEEATQLGQQSYDKDL